MKSDNLALSVVASLLIGALQFFALTYFWGVLILYVQYVPWLVAHGVTGTTLRVMLFVFDNLVNLVLCLPAAYCLLELRPRRLPLYLALAVVPGFVWGFRLMVKDTNLLKHWALFVPGAMSELLILPLAVLVFRYAAMRRAA